MPSRASPAAADDVVARNAMRPVSVNLRALPSRLTRIWRRHLASRTTTAGTVPSAVSMSVSPLSAAAWANIAVSSRSSARTSVAFGYLPTGSGDLLKLYRLQNDTEPTGTAIWEILAPPLSFNAIWSPVGTSGRLIADYFDGAFTTRDVEIGTWVMVEPHVVPITAAVAGLGFVG